MTFLDSIKKCTQSSQNCRKWLFHSLVSLTLLFDTYIFNTNTSHHQVCRCTYIWNHLRLHSPLNIEPECKGQEFFSFSDESNWTCGTCFGRSCRPPAAVCTPTIFIICLDIAIPCLMDLVTITAVLWWHSMPSTSPRSDWEQPDSYDIVCSGAMSHTNEGYALETLFQDDWKGAFNSRDGNDLAGATPLMLENCKLFSVLKFLGLESNSLSIFKY